MVSRASLVAASGAVAMLLSACSPGVSPSPSEPSTSASPTVASATPSTPSPTETWSKRDRDAVAAVDAYKAAARRIENDPAAFTEKQMKALLGKVAGPEVVSANVGSYLDLRKRGFRYAGAATSIWTNVTGAVDHSNAVEVVITRCYDQRGIEVLDKAGNAVDEATLGYGIPEFNLRQYQVVKPNGERQFRVFGLSGPRGDSCHE